MSSKCEYCSTKGKILPKRSLWHFPEFLGCVLVLLALTKIVPAVPVGSLGEPLVALGGFASVVFSLYFLVRFIIDVKATITLPRQFVFLDTHGRQHFHRHLFAGGYAGYHDHNGKPVYVDGYVLELWQPLLQLFRKSRILYIYDAVWYLHPTNRTAGPEPGEYNIRAQWHIVDYDHNLGAVSLVDNNDCVIHHTWLELVKVWIPFGSVITAMANTATPLQTLGIEVVGIVQEIIEDPARLGRSRHAQYLRERLQRTLRRQQFVRFLPQWEEAVAEHRRREAARHASATA